MKPVDDSMRSAGWLVERWYEAVNHCEHTAQPYALITVLSAAGSTPRDQGTKMVVTPERQYDTIGGGHLEHKAISLAREALAQAYRQRHNAQLVHSFPLASSLGQCCGGAVKLLIETHVCHQQVVALFGAGHVAQSLVPILSQLPLQIKWYDNREGLQPTLPLPSNVQFQLDEEPAGDIALLPSESWVIIMTHDHQLDFTLAEKALKRNDLPYVGMIGSQTKRRRFEQRLSAKGVSSERLQQFYSPIGDPVVPGKRPIEVAVSVSAQIIQRLHTRTTKPQPLHNTQQDTHDA